MGCICTKGIKENDPISKSYTTVNSPAESVEIVLLWISELQEKQIWVNKPPADPDILYMNWHNIQHDPWLIEALKNTSFVTSADEELCKPTDLFDPGDALLASLFSGEDHKFPGERFVSDGWLSILRKIGLQNTRGADTVLQCARRIEYLVAQSHDEGQLSSKIWSLAETLIERVIENSALLHDEGFCNVFGKIACVPAEQGFPFNTRVKRVVCSYSDAILLKDWPLAWSAAPILCKIPPGYSWKALLLRSPPPFTRVLKHLQHREMISPSCFLTREDATFEVLKYLDTNWSTLSSSDVSKLSRVPFISIAKAGSSACAMILVTRLKINLPSIAYELPLRYMSFVKILKQLGLHDTLSLSSAMTILSGRHQDCLDPNELGSVIELLNFICKEIEHHKPDRLNWESELRVPDIDCRLVPSNLCVYIDPFASQQYVKYIASSKMRLVHPHVSERLCLAFGITKLSDVVVEELDCVEHLETLKETGSVSLAAIRSKLLSRSFKVAVSSVVNKFSSVTTGFTNPDFSTLERSLDSVAERLQFVQSIHTRLRCLDVTCASTVPPEWERESRLYFVDRSNTCMLIAKPPSYMLVLDLVANVVSRVLGSPVRLPICSLLLCPQDSETALVKRLKLISSHDRVIQAGTGFLLGRPLLPIDEKKVRFIQTITPFAKGAIVAWQSGKGERLKYGKISKDVKPTLSEWQAPYRYNVETSPGKFKAIIASQVFQFKGYCSCSEQDRLFHG